MSSDVEIYCGQMEEIKQRIEVIRNFLNSNSTFGNENFNYEFTCIHLRKILELIAFSTLVANKEEYSRIHQNYSKQWRTKELLKSINKINPNFYPKPIKLGPADENGIKHFENVTSDFLVKKDWEKLYYLCSEVLHVWNPYKDKAKYLNFEKPITEWVENIQNLLDFHCVRLVNDRNVWLITMSHPETGKVQASIAEPVE